MTIEPLRLTVLTPAETLLEAEGVAWVQVRLADGGGIGIYPGHAPLLAETVAAPLVYQDAAGEHRLMLDAGILSVERGGVTLFTQPAAEVVERETEAHFQRLAEELLLALKAQAAWSWDDQEEG